MSRTQPHLIKPEKTSSKPVQCLALNFPNDEARQQHFLSELRKRLADPAFKEKAGYPVGTDEDILALSDPPFYTACPNPFVGDFIQYHSASRTAAQPYHREPFAADVSEGKNDPIYNAHSYHTKVPHKAIMRYILHYTQPGDIVFDGFCGTGMTGVAAQLCAQPDPEFRQQAERDAAASGQAPPRWGIRHAVLCDLSPAASFIAHNYNTPFDQVSFDEESERILDELASACGWMFTTSEGGKSYPITYTIWSDVFSCPECGKEVVFWDAAVDVAAEKVSDEFPCPSCKAMLSKDTLHRLQETTIDFVSKKPIKKSKQIPVLIEYLKGSKRLTKRPDKQDFQLLQKIELEGCAVDYPAAPINRDIDLWYERDYTALGIFDVAHFYTMRTLRTLAEYRSRVHQVKDERVRQALLWSLTSVAEGASRLNRERPGGMPSKLSGTLYVGALIREINPIEFLRRKHKKFKELDTGASGNTCITTQSSTNLDAIPDASIDYIFTDPPFGSNIIYSDLSILWESWLDLYTNTQEEAVVHRRKKQDAHKLEDYFQLMLAAFTEMNRILKPGRWITVEFHNTKNAVWNAIQEALQRANFVIADVRILDKKQGSFKQITAAGAVKNDLVISAYRPSGEQEESFKVRAGSEAAVWDFIKNHLRQLPVFVTKQGKAETLVERQKYLLYDRMVAYHVQHGVTIPISAPEFYVGMEGRFPQRDGMYFLPEQAAEYDRKRITVSELAQLELFVFDEASAIQWLKQQLSLRPQTFQEIQPHFMKELAGWQKHEQSLELSVLLEQNFLRYEGDGEVPPPIHGYLSSNFRECRNLAKNDPVLIARAKNRWYVPNPGREADLERIRHRALLKEFSQYQQTKGRLKVVRTEALRAGFKECWQNGDYAAIVALAKRVPEEVIQEDAALFMYFENASMRTEG